MTPRRRGATRAAGVLLAALSLAVALPVQPAAATPRLGTAIDVQERLVTIPITLHLAATDAGLVVAPQRIRGWLAHANRVLHPHGVRLEVVAVAPLPAGSEVARTFGERRRLASRADASSLHVFVVDRLDREKKLSRTRVRGIWWRTLLRRSGVGAGQVVMLSSFANRETLAHEVGHALGLDHRRRPDNLMCSCDRRPDATFDAAQGQALRLAAHRLMVPSR